VNALQTINNINIHCVAFFVYGTIENCRRQKLLVGGDPLYLKFWISDRLPIFDLFSLVAPQP